MKKPMIIGHRGYPSRYPENTLKSFNTALEHGAEMIELDVHLTKDNHLIVMHDSDLSRMTGVDKEVRKLTLAEIKKLKIEGEEIPTLEEAIDFLKGKCIINIESKVKEAAIPIVEMIKKKDVVEDVIVASRISSFLKTIKHAHPFIRTSWVFERPSLIYILWAKILGVYSLQPHISIATARMVRRAHKNNLKVFVWWHAYPLWRVNINKIKRIQPDGIITHDPKVSSGWFDAEKIK
jgi:glycerophosphoryl diester phosphodiesterase